MRRDGVFTMHKLIPEETDYVQMHRIKADKYFKFDEAYFIRRFDYETFLMDDDIYKQNFLSYLLCAIMDDKSIIFSTKMHVKLAIRNEFKKMKNIKERPIKQNVE